MEIKLEPKVPAATVTETLSQEGGATDDKSDKPPAAPVDPWT